VVQPGKVTCYKDVCRFVFKHARSVRFPKAPSLVHSSNCSNSTGGTPGGPSLQIRLNFALTENESLGEGERKGGG